MLKFQTSMNTTIFARCRKNIWKNISIKLGLELDEKLVCSNRFRIRLHRAPLYMV